MTRWNSRGRRIGRVTGAMLATLSFAWLLTGPPPGAEDDSPHGPMSIPCGTCHTPESWRIEGSPAGFDHDRTGFPLDGAHRQAACASCHRDLAFSRVGTACLDCHADVHEGELGTDCRRCHSSDGWTVRRPAVDQHASTRFPLVGAHATLDCDACHRSAATGEFGGTPVTCDGCHLPLYAATTRPPHAAAGFGVHCDECHSVGARDWSGSGFMHPGSFPLTGGHAAAECSACHASGYAGTSTACWSCHQADFAAAADPDHVAGGYPHECAQCHGTASWSGATFDHAAAGFPLTGAHAGAACASCHASGYAGTSPDCYACHRADYDGAADPDHSAAGFPHGCVSCHGTTAWTPSSWSHEPLFPIASGAHREAWTRCTDCHVQPSSFAVFECILCHEHDRASTDEHHREIAAYVYQSQACYQCHPRGRAE